MRGLSDEKGSWKMSCILRRTSCMRPARQIQDILALVQHLPAAGLDQPQQAAPKGRLARAGFADQPEDLALRDA